MTVSIKISNIVYLKKPVKDYAKPFRFTVTMTWEDIEGRSHGCDILGCLGGVGRDGRSEWNGPMYWMGRKAARSVHFENGTYEAVLQALNAGGYFKWHLEDLLPRERPVTSEEEYGLPGEINVTG